MVEKRSDSKALEALLEEARVQVPTPPDDLMARVLADALEVQPVAHAAPRADPRAAPRRGPLGELLRVLGGWPSMAGLATATAAGLWLGAFPPGALPDATFDYLGLDEAAYLIDTAPDLGFDLGEGAL